MAAGLVLMMPPPFTSGLSDTVGGPWHILWVFHVHPGGNDDCVTPVGTVGWKTAPPLVPTDVTPPLATAIETDEE